jgi:hypothetical protein
MKQRKGWGKLLAAFLLGGGLLAAGIARIDLHRFLPAVEQELAKALGRPVRIGRLAPVMLPPGVVAEGIEMAAAGKGSESPLVIERVRLFPRLLPLLGKKIVLRRIELHRPRLHLERDRHGRFLPDFAAGSASGPAPRDASGLAAESIVLVGGSFSYVDKGTASRVVLEGIDLWLTDLQLLAGKPFAVRNLAGRGRLAIREAKSGTFTLARMESDFEQESGVLRLQHLAFTAVDCRFRGTAAVDFRRRPLGVSLEQLITLGGKEGNVFRAEGELTVAPGAGFPAALGGTLAISGQDLVVTGYYLDTILAQYEKSRELDLIDIGSFFVAGPFGPVVTQAFDAAGTSRGIGRGRSTITRLVAAWQIEKGVATARDVALSTERNLIAARGQLDLVDRRFRDFRVAVLDRHRCAVFSQAVKGTFAAPDYGATEFGLKSLAGTVTSLLTKARNMVRDCEPFYRGSLVHPLAEGE